MPIEENSPFDLGAMQAPAIFINRFQVAVTSNGLVRIAAGEGFGPGHPFQYRTAILMGKEDALALAQVIMNSCSPNSPPGS